MDFKRSDRVAERVKAEVSDLLLRKVNDPRIGFVTLTRVKASDDLRNITIYVAAHGSEARKKKCLEGLKSATPFFEREVFRRLEIKAAPELLFRIDDSLEKGQEVLELIKKANEPGEGGA